MRVHTVRGAGPSGFRPSFPVPSPRADLWIGALTCEPPQVIDDAASNNRHCQKPSDSTQLGRPDKWQCGCHAAVKKTPRVIGSSGHSDADSSDQGYLKG